jgi:pimeloyl-ACP methyl ester carboxylesterase
LVHGWGADTETNWVYSGWVEKLTPFRRVISIDVRGHGKSDKPHQQELYSYAAMSRDVIALMDQLNIERADFFGYSMGAFMGAYLLGHHGERFSSMVLGGIGDETQQSADLSYYIAAALRAGKLVGDFFHVTDPRFDLEALALSCVEMWHDGYPRKLGGAGLMQTSNPVLVINGGQDYPYVQTDQDLVDMIPGARLFRIPGKNHLTAFLDKRFDEAVLGFLAEQAP